MYCFNDVTITCETRVTDECLFQNIIVTLSRKPLDVASANEHWDITLPLVSGAYQSTSV